MTVCRQCFKSIESRSGKQMSLMRFVDDSEESNLTCDWCHERIYDVQYEINEAFQSKSLLILRFKTQDPFVSNKGIFKDCIDYILVVDGVYDLSEIEDAFSSYLDYYDDVEDEEAIATVMNSFKVRWEFRTKDFPACENVDILVI